MNELTRNEARGHVFEQGAERWLVVRVTLNGRRVTRQVQLEAGQREVVLDGQRFLVHRSVLRGETAVRLERVV